MDIDEDLLREDIPLLEQDESDVQESKIKQMKREIIPLIKTAIPIIITGLSTFLIMTESIIISGNLSKYELDSCALANSMINVIGLAVGTGLCTACDTFFSQMYGSKHRKSIGTMLVKSTMIITIFPIILLALHINMEPIFILLKQEEKIAKGAAQYMIFFSPGLLFGFYALILTRYMQNQNRVLPPMIIGIIVNFINIFSQYLTVYQFKFGFNASPVCQAVTFFFLFLIQLLYIIFSKLYKETWNGWTREVFLDWYMFVKLAIPGAAMVVMECFCFEIGTLLSGMMGSVELAAQSVMFQLETITFMISFGVGIAVNIRVGQHLGSGNSKKALMAYRCGLCIMIISFCITATLILGLTNQLPVLFTNDKEAQLLSSELLPILVGVQFFDAIGTVTMGALRGCGRQKICVLIIFFSYYLLGQPIGISLAFAANLKVKGLWIGLLISLSICVPIGFIYTNFIQNWQTQADLCQKRIAEAIHQQECEETKIENLDIKEIFPNESNQFHVSHRRSISKSFQIKSHGDLIVTKYIEIDKKDYQRIYFQKSFIYLAAVSVLIAGVLVNIFYVPQKPNNITNITSH